MTPTGIKTASKMIAVVERPPLSSLLLPPSVVTSDEATVIPLKEVPSATAALMAFSVLIAAFEPAALVEVTAVLRMTEP